MKIKKLISINILIILIVVIIVGPYFWNEYLVKKDEQKRQEIYNKILDGTLVKPAEVTVDYFGQSIVGSPFVFGGAQYPDSKNSEIWNMLQEVGATVMRTDFYIENMVPYNTSIEEYKNNKNNVQNIDTWNKDFIQSRRDAYNSAKSHGMKTIGIMSYSPAWLTYSQTTRGIPKDWGVYEDIVRKAYTIHRDSIDYLELWNEPTYSKVFLDVTGSGLTPTEAYAQIFYHAAKAVREVDQEKNDGKKIFIGGPASDNPNDTSMLEEILKNEKTRQYVDFISYHNYTIDEPSWDAHKEIMKKYHVDNLPVFITEWNYNPKENEDSPYKTSYPAILFTGNKLVDFLKMGVAGANYYSFLPLNTTEKNAEYLSFYKSKDDHIELLPQARAWRLLSKDMGLGKGKSNIFLSQNSTNDFNILGFKNSSKQQGIVIINNSKAQTTVNMHLKNYGKKNYIKVAVYFASANNDGIKPVYEGLIKEKNNVLDFPFYVPGETIMGVVFGQENGWYDFSQLINL